MRQLIEGNILRGMSSGEGTELHFPDVPKLELDQLIDQLVERAEGVRQAQGRLRNLLRAIEAVTGDLTLATVLRNVVEASVTVARARYGALGMISPEGGLEQFVHVGMDAETVARIDHLPEGKGLLGALISDPEPIRLEHLGEDERSSGFPAGHPPMESFLGVPIRVRGEIFGNLYLTDSLRGQFSAEDAELINALALAAGTAIANARLYDEARRKQQWLTASVEIGAQLLAATGEDPLKLIARRAFDIADAELVAVGLLTPDGAELLIETAVGETADELIARRFRLSDTLAGRVVEQREPILLPSSEPQPTPSYVSSVFDAGPVMTVPLMGTAQVRGVMTLARARGHRAFSATDLNMAASFASQASVALELADARAAEQRVVLLEDRERIARDLHDHVIQELFAIGLSLESMVGMFGANHPAAQRMQERVADLDRTIRQIRTSIFQLRGPLAVSATGLRQQVLTITSELAPALGFTPRATFEGPVDLVVWPELVDDVVATVREGLANIAKHAQASRAGVDVSVTPSELLVVVSDNGVGMHASTRRSGLSNLRERAELHGGSFRTSAGTSGGTTLTWKVPIT
jgi:signal transduction histidine kinase